MTWRTDYCWRKGIAAGQADRLIEAFGQTESGSKPTMGLPPESLVVQPLIEPLSERELEVLRLIAAGLSNRQIAEELVIEVSTVKSHANHIFGKLGVRSRTQAVVKAQALGLLE